MMAAGTYLSGAVEGPSDESVLRRLIHHAGAEVHRIQVQQGKTRLRSALPGMNAAAQRAGWIVLVDLDDGPCARGLVEEWLPIPSAPESVAQPKDVIVALARQSRRRAIREDMVPRERSGRRVGPAYTSRLIEFTESDKFGWRPEVAATHAPSLRRCIERVRELVSA